jgi:hypothetical protein
MSDYFAALTRSAGPALERREPPRDQANIVEQNVERVSDSPGLAHASPLPHAEPAIAAASTAQDSEPAPLPAARPVQRTPIPTASPQSASADLPEALVRNAAVSAALRWVAADPARQQAASKRSIIDAASGRAAGPVIEQQLDTLPVTANDPDCLDAEPAWIEIQTARPAARDRGQRPERARTLTAEATLVDRRADDLPQLHEERVEVSIGTIHLRVDAPSQPAVVAQPMPAPQTRPERREEPGSSGFSRCRVPRL